MNRLKMQSPDVIGSNVEKIKALFPHCVTEKRGENGELELAVDFEKLQLELSNDIIGEGEERYQFTWPDKRKAIREANVRTTSTLRPCRAESVDFDTTENLYIEGDNLEVLKVLRETYLGKVKMIYIDPPYNTGNDFVYNDDFAQGKSEFEQSSGLFDEEGNQTIDPMQRNTESNGRFHTDWLNMMYPRLKVARDLLDTDGFIFVSIDEGEIENLKKVMNEIFGEGNIVDTFFWKSIFRPSNMSKTIRKNAEYLLCYRKCMGDFELVESYEDPQGDASLTQNNNAVRTLLFPSKFVKISLPNGVYPKGVYDAIEVLDDIIVSNGTSENDFRIAGKFKWSQEYLNEEVRKGVTLSIKSRGLIPYYRKDYQKTALRPTKLISPERVGDVLQAGAEIRSLFENQLFDYPKPTSLIKFLLDIIRCQEGIILDFFSGSATTAHAVIKLNAEDGGNRKFIMVQLPEKTEEKSEAYKAGYKNICEIGKERIRRAGKKVKEEAGLQGQDLDTGFRVLKLDSSNMEDVYYTPESFDASKLFVDNVKVDRSSEDLLFQVMLELGVELSAKIESKNVVGKEVYFVDDNYLVACFDTDLNEAAITEIAKMNPVYFVMRDSSMSSDNVADNFDQIFQHYSKDTVRRIL